MILTVVATGADTTRPLGWEAVTATCRGDQGVCEVRAGATWLDGADRHLPIGVGGEWSRTGFGEQPG